jgi:hypothetical protein
MHTNDKALGRNWYTADTASIKHGPDWHRWELHWADGGLAYGVEETIEEAREALRRYGFHPIE